MSGMLEINVYAMFYKSTSHEFCFLHKGPCDCVVFFSFQSAPIFIQFGTCTDNLYVYMMAGFENSTLPGFQVTVHSCDGT